MSRRQRALREDDRALLAAAERAREAGRLDEALALCERVLARRADVADALWFKGVLLHKLGRSQEGLKFLRRATVKAPATPDYHDALAVVLRALGRFEEALKALDRALAVAPDYAHALINRAGVLTDLGRLEEAEAACRRALALGLATPAAHNNFGAVLNKMGRHEEARATFANAVRADPGYVDARSNLAHVELLLGHFESGWRHYDARLESPGLRGQVERFAGAVPLWDGRELAGEAVLLHAEQGLGDTIHFVRYAPLVAARGGRVVVECQAPLAALIATVPGVDRAIPRGEPLPALAAQLPMLSLPRVFATTLATIPAEVPYLSPPPGPVPPPLEPPPVGLRVGIVWAGNPDHANDRNRSCPFAWFAGLAEVPGVSLYSLQVGARAAEVAREPRIVDLAPWLDDFAATARALTRLDLVIAVDTAVAHLAGALARPLWLLLPFVPDWRWLLHRDDSPWYPTARLFRQSAPGDWQGVLARVRDALAALAA